MTVRSGKAGWFLSGPVGTKCQGCIGFTYLMSREQQLVPHELFVPFLLHVLSSKASPAKGKQLHQKGFLEASHAECGSDQWIIESFDVR